MSTISLFPSITRRRPDLWAEEIFASRLSAITRRTDHLFAALLTFEWVVAIATALIRSPQTWDGSSSRIHTHLWAALILGAAIISPPVLLCIFRTGATSTRHVVAVAQSLMGSLLIHLMDGRIETHFHIFGSLAVLAVYRDWRVLITASAVVAIDHFVRGFYMPFSVFGVVNPGPWRWAEHAGWVAVEDVFLIRTCRQNIEEMREIAEHESGLSRANEDLAHEVVERKRAEESSALMVAVLNATPDFVGIADANKQVIYVNAAGLRMTGLTKQDLTRATISDFLKPSGGEAIARHAMQAAVRDGSWRGEVEMRRSGGGEIPVSMVILAHKDPYGNPEYYSTIARDVTQRKRVENELLRAQDELEARVAERTSDLRRAIDGLAKEAAERKLAEQAQARMVAMLNATTDFVGINDASGRVLYLNAAGLRMVGKNEADASRSTLRDYFTDWSNEIIAKEGLPTAIRDGVWSGEVALLGGDGREIPVSMVALSHKDSKGNVEFVSTIARDITERKRADEANARLAAIVAFSSDAVIGNDLSGIVTSWNHGAECLFGYTAEEMVGTSIDRIIPSEYRSEKSSLLEPLLQGERVESFESVRLTKNGRRVDVSLTISPICDVSGKIIGASKIARDISDRKRAEQEIRLLNSQLECRLNRLNSLRQIDTAITASFDLSVTLSTLLQQVKAQLGVDAADVLLLDLKSRTLKSEASLGFRSVAMRQVALDLDTSVPGLVAAECMPCHLVDLTQTSRAFIRARTIEEEGFVSYSAVPLVSQGVVRGVLEVFHRSTLDVDQEWLDFLEALAGQAAIAINSARLFEDLQRSNADLTLAYDATIEGWSRALDLRDKETEGHTRRVTEMSIQLARSMGITGAALHNVRRGALLHDVGKLGVPDSILLKPGKLTDDEWQVMRLHPTYAYEWLSPISFLRPALDIPHCHHEKWDGTGYPRGLKGEDIPLSARIFAAVDIWDALRSDRPYREGWSESRVLDHIRSLSGSHLDPQVVESFLQYFSDEPIVPPPSPRDAVLMLRHEAFPVVAAHS